ncbi:MAG: ferrous iron transport protein B [Flavipsychrobacter sp.]|nr:ferrous iron transport protein B [Flavipsychrobacter sp.]
MQRPFTIALVGNPNSGKSSLFNSLTGLNQKVGNFPGVTVDKKTGVARISEQLTANVIDLPGTYSIYPKSADEYVTYEVLLNSSNKDKPDLLVVIADASNLKRNLLFCSQIMDLKIPVVIALSMVDIARTQGTTIDIEGLQRMMGVPVVAINPRKNKGISQLKKIVGDMYTLRPPVHPDFIDIKELAGNWVEEVKLLCGQESNYGALQVACNYMELHYLQASHRIRVAALLDEVKFNKAAVQAAEIMQRYRRIDDIIRQCVVMESPIKKTIASDKIDRVLLHPLWGNLILLLVLFTLFQSIFWLADYPMTWVEEGFSVVRGWALEIMPDNFFRDLLVNGILAGIGGIAIFIPQIMILFGFITILEDSGYMARISFLTDRLMRSAGLNGRSVMPLISGMACAVPAIMSARTIQNRKERLITIMVTPLMSCSARLPVYTILIGLVIPERQVLGFFSMQGLVLMALYLLGFFMALLVAKVLDKLIKTKERTYFLMELPVYRSPRWANVGITMVEKAKVFVTDAGKVIMVISVVLWALASFGPPARMQAVEAKYTALKAAAPQAADSLDKLHATDKLENSFAGIMGHAIEPAIRPLGYDWKIGIALITSFAAREVFVGTMSTLYSVGDDTDDRRIREKMADARFKDGRPVYTLASGLSLLVFYVFAMQCMSTLAIVKRETNSWKIPMLQLLYMSVLAYVGGFIVYQLFK